MAAWVEIRKNATGEVRRYRDEYFDHDPEVSDYVWRDGNLSCDCNRAHLFALAGKEEDPNVNCGSKLYTVIRAVCDDGSVVTIDDE